MNLNPIDLTKKEKYKGFGNKAFYKRFKNAVMSGHLHTIRYLVLVENISIRYDNDFVFRIACKKGYLDIVEYCLTNNELKEHCNINIDNDVGIIKACEFNHLHIVKFLLSSDKLIKKSNVFCRDGKLFQISQQNNHFELQKYLLNFKLEKNLSLKNYSTLNVVKI